MVQLVPVDGQEIPHVVLDLFKDAIDGIPLRSTPRCVPAVLLTRWSSTSYLIIKESATDACEEDNLEAARSMAKLTLEIAVSIGRMTASHRSGKASSNLRPAHPCPPACMSN
ncbi:hypothetical protein CYMTET_14997 [Cymbomonas tetramitiformis]|uniref:Uncharacterized protein n=1 Tax=Cymbomonas tetramitiformis TaxID=36881 RepID=A0AAE0GGF1_9CHLO|nr:hypothetical protein CYMTET_14997 [Cymbomonas tetramitiformis]